MPFPFVRLPEFISQYHALSIVHIALTGFGIAYTLVTIVVFMIIFLAKKREKDTYIKELYSSWLRKWFIQILVGLFSGLLGLYAGTILGLAGVFILGKKFYYSL